MLSRKEKTEIRKCYNNPIYFMDNYVTINPEMEIIHGSKFKLTAKQKRIIRSIDDNRFTMLNACRQSGKTTLLLLYMLWKASYSPKTRFMFCGMSEKSVSFIKERFIKLYDSVPTHLKTALDTNNKQTVKFYNGSIVDFMVFSPSSICGHYVDVLLFDEGFYSVTDDFWDVIQPLISHQNSKMIFAGTMRKNQPKVLTDIWKIPNNGWNKISFMWYEIMRVNNKGEFDPEHFEEYMTNILSEDEFLMEYCCEVPNSIV